MADGYLLVSENLPKQIEDILSTLGYRCVRIPCCEYLDAPVASHPDMLFYRIKDGTLLCDRRYYESNAKLLESTGARFVFSVGVLDKKYPNDVLFDAFEIDGTVYGRLDSIAPEILENGKNAVDLKQGYAKCSTLLLGNAAITADGGICRALQNGGIDVLKLSGGGIGLPGYGEGFIGGASYFDANGRNAVFFGDISEHQEYEEITGFLKERNISLLYPKGIPLTDFGGAVAVN